MSKIELDRLLNGVAQLETTDLEQFAEQVSLLLAQRKTLSLSPIEAELLQRINQGLPEATQRRYTELMQKRRSETLHREIYAETRLIASLRRRVNAESVAFIN